MKIIGVCGKNYLAEVGSDELEVLTGIGSGFGNADQGYTGRSYEIRKAWNTIRAIQSNSDELPKIAGKLRALADLLEPIITEIPVVS